mgnify:CR=1 FL=1
MYRSSPGADLRANGTRSCCDSSMLHPSGDRVEARAKSQQEIPDPHRADDFLALATSRDEFVNLAEEVIAQGHFETKSQVWSWSM